MSRALATALLATALATAGCAPKQSEPTAAAKPAFDAKDFSGTWDRYPLPTENSGQDPTVVPRPEPIPPPPLKAEFMPAWDAEQKKINEANAAGEPIATGYTHCIPDGMPAMMMAMFPMEVLQTPRQTTIIQEAYNQVRRIYLNDTLPAVEDAEPGFWGHSTGKWEGNDFVVETVGIKEHVRFRNAPHSAAMRIHERMRMIDADHFENDVTVEDPEFLTGPWKWKWVYQRRPNYKMYEYVCEDNREYADPVTGKARMRINKR
ncbi:MAG: hypothetical protein IPM70_09340 [Proteobacteria bacterium]|nr:hypothetical protein [Pseudomonadota bacterium]